MKKRILSIAVSVSLSLSCFCGDFGRVAVAAQTEDVITESQADNTENDSEIEPESDSDNNEAESNGENSSQSEDNNSEGDSSEKTDGSTNDTNNDDTNSYDSNTTESESSDSVTTSENSDNNDQTENLDDQNLEEDTSADDYNNESDDENTADNEDVQEEFQFETEADMTYPQADDESDYILPTQEKDGMFYKIDADGKMTVWGKNIKAFGLTDELKEKVIYADVSGIIVDGNALFYDFPNMKNIYFHDYDTSNVSSMKEMFRWCYALESLDLSGFNTSNVTDMQFMFCGDRGFTSLDLSGFDTSNVSNMNYMFGGCSTLASLNISKFDTSNVEDMGSMFNGCSALTSLELSNFNTSKVQNMSWMFYECSALTSLELSNFNTSKVQNMSWMFNECSGLTSLDLSGFDTSKVQNMSWMFYGCSGLTSLDVSGFDTSNVNTMSSMFSGCSKLTSLDVSNFDTSNVNESIGFLTSGGFASMFSGCESLTTLDLSNFNTSNVCSMSGMFYNCKSLVSLDVNNFDTSNVQEMRSMFYGCKSLEKLDLSSFDTSNVKKYYKFSFPLGSGSSPYGGGFDYMFSGCESLTSLDLSNFSTKSAYRFNAMFSNCKSLKNLDIRNFDLKYDSSVRESGYLNSLFYGCDSLTEIWGPTILAGTPEINLYNSFYIDDDSNGVMDYGTEPVSVLKSGPHHFIRVGEVVDALLMGARGVLEHTDEDGAQGFVTFNISEKEFTENESTIYNHEIARFACGLSTMAYSEKASTIKQCFKDLGYTFDGDINDSPLSDGDLIYVKDKKGDEATYWIGNKNLYDGSALVTVLIRGTDGREWFDNFEPGTGGVHHDGFYRGAKSVLDGLNEYFNNHPELKEKRVKLLVTGHSRGAAVANLVGMEVDSDTSGRFGFIENSDTFVYTFATPNVTCDDIRNRYNSCYLNIFNIVNPEDFVTKVLLSDWGYGRYGITLVLPSKSNTDAVKYNSYLGKMRADWKSYFSSGFEKEYTPYKGGMKEVTDYVLGVNKLVKNVNDYYNKIQIGVYIVGLGADASTLHQLYNDTLATYMSGVTLGKETGLANFILALDGKYGLLGIKTALYFITHQAVKPEFGYGHQSESYMAAMNTVSREELLRHKTILEGVINCPVDITITDESGNVIGTIENNEIATEVEDSAVSLNVDGDSKTFMIPAEGNYHVTLTGNDEGVMDYSLCEYDCDTLMGSRIYYHNVPVSDGKAYEMEITGGADLNSYELIDDAGSVVSNKQEISEEASNQLSVDITVEGNGHADSFSNLTPGDYVTLNAVPEENSEFAGWYDLEGTLISSDAEYGLSIAESMKFIARFTDKENAGSESNEEKKPVQNTENEQNNSNVNNTTDETIQNLENVGDELPAVGTEFISAGKGYSINGDDTVTITKLVNKKSKTLNIPSSVVYEGHVYSVTRIKEKAFKGLKKLKSVSIPSSVESVGSKAFYNCPSLKKVTIKANSSLTIGKGAFKKMAKDGNIKVKGLKKKAKAAMVKKIQKQTNGTVN